MKKQILLALVLLSTFCSYSKPIKYYQNSNNIDIGAYSEIFTDPVDSLTINEVIKINKFIPSNDPVPNLGISSNAFWIKFSIQNESDFKKLLLEYKQPFIDEISVYEVDPKINKIIQIHKSGDKYHFDHREYDYQNYIFCIQMQKGEIRDLYVHLKSGEQIVLPIVLGNTKSILQSNHGRDIVFGIYCGIILVMFFYNLFIYFTLRDPIYLKYVIYILAIGMTQASLLGYPFEYLWPNLPWFANQSVYLFSCMVSISALEFLKTFLQVKIHAPVLYKISFIFTSSYILTAILSLTGYFNVSYFLVLANAALIAIYMLIVAIVIFQKGYKPALFFLVAWSSMLVGIIIYVLKDFNILPPNNFTNYTMPVGSAIEVILLSFALADRINILKKEKEESQSQAFNALLQNELIIRNQNIVLEKNVEERTKELKNTNNELSTTLSELKQTQSQLVNAEKMASLGQLTAGIAHEINNPINFVVSNVKPLKRDIEDIYELVHKYETINKNDNFDEQIAEINTYKSEIDYTYIKEEIGYLLKGIEDGAIRTADIVRGLRVFSRLDENDLKRTNIIEGINSTLTLLNPEISGSMELIKNFSYFPEVECFPEKLNQVFMNILNNAIFAIKENKDRKEKGQLVITTSNNQSHVFISIKDNGIGMTNEVKEKIFEPFFTTKAVGKGTGLGMSITFSIISDHRGTIQLHTEYGKGSEFIIALPINYSNE